VTPRMRWVRFNVVGVAGFVLQIVTLSLLVRCAGLTTSVAVTVAVLVAVSHNFVWHEHFTWPNQPREGRLRRWLSFHVSTGALSVVTNVGATTLVMTLTGLPVVAANVVAVALASIVNFLVSDRLVFGR
jgi:dolichol-phosphate mannosyltransferase